MQPVPTAKAPMPLQMTQWILNPVGYLEANFKRYGDIFQAYVSLGNTDPLILVNEPKAVQFLLTHDTGKEFTAPGEVNRILEPLLGRHNLMMLSGREHQQRRQLVMPPFHGERLKAFGQLIQQITHNVMAQWPANKSLNVRSAMQKITMRVILQAVFGLYQGDRYERLELLLSQRLNMIDTPLASTLFFLPWLQKDFGPWSPGGRILKLVEETDRLPVRGNSRATGQSIPGSNRYPLSAASRQR